MPTAIQGPGKQTCTRANTVPPPRKDCPACADAMADVDRIRAAALRLVDDADALIAEKNLEIARLRGVVAFLTRRLTADQDAAQAKRSTE
jgi:uncharacterized coiled-coil protein SlyX